MPTIYNCRADTCPPPLILILRPEPRLLCEMVPSEVAVICCAGDEKAFDCNRGSGQSGKFPCASTAQDGLHDLRDHQPEFATFTPCGSKAGCYSESASRHARDRRAKGQFALVLCSRPANSRRSRHPRSDRKRQSTFCISFQRSADQPRTRSTAQERNRRSFGPSSDDICPGQPTAVGRRAVCRGG